jgi:hypothetical protein
MAKKPLSKIRRGRRSFPKRAWGRLRRSSSRKVSRAREAWFNTYRVKDDGLAEDGVAGEPDEDAADHFKA